MFKNQREFLTWVLTLFILFLLFVGIYRNKETPEERTARIEQYRKEAYNTAVSCSDVGTPLVRFEDITWVITPGDKLIYNGIDGTISFMGFADTRDNTIYIPEAHATKRWIMTHEVLHLLGFIGHPDHPFKTCGVMPE